MRIARAYRRRRSMADSKEEKHNDCRQAGEDKPEYSVARHGISPQGEQAG